MDEMQNCVGSFLDAYFATDCRDACSVRSHQFLSLPNTKKARPARKKCGQSLRVGWGRRPSSQRMGGTFSASLLAAGSGHRATLLPSANDNGMRKGASLLPFHFTQQCAFLSG